MGKNHATYETRQNAGEIALNEDEDSEHNILRQPALPLGPLEERVNNLLQLEAQGKFPNSKTKKAKAKSKAKAKAKSKPKAKPKKKN